MDMTRGQNVSRGQQGEGNKLTNKVIPGSRQDLLVCFPFLQEQDDIIWGMPFSQKYTEFCGWFEGTISRKGKVCGFQSFSLSMEVLVFSVNMSHHICIIKKVSGGNPQFLTDHMLDSIGCSYCLRSPFGIHSDGGSKPIGMEK